jgi:hypothetical protein
MLAVMFYMKPSVQPLQATDGLQDLHPIGHTIGVVLLAVTLTVVFVLMVTFVELVEVELRVAVGLTAAANNLGRLLSLEISISQVCSYWILLISWVVGISKLPY